MYQIHVQGDVLLHGALALIFTVLAAVTTADQTGLNPPTTLAELVGLHVIMAPAGTVHDSELPPSPQVNEAVVHLPIAVMATPPAPRVIFPVDPLVITVALLALVAEPIVNVVAAIVLVPVPILIVVGPVLVPLLAPIVTVFAPVVAPVTPPIVTVFVPAPEVEVDWPIVTILLLVPVLALLPIISEFALVFATAPTPPSVTEFIPVPLLLRPMVVVTLPELELELLAMFTVLAPVLAKGPMPPRVTDVVALLAA